MPDQPRVKYQHKTSRKDVREALDMINHILEAKHLKVDVEWQGKAGLTLVKYVGRVTLARNLTKRAAIEFIKGMQAMSESPDVQPGGPK